ncbi:MAG TPA: MFS transporter, partial [Terriglobales bacterium]|nr:MFS transporter [Terriglobales bacterium]
MTGTGWVHISHDGYRTHFLQYLETPVYSPEPWCDRHRRSAWLHLRWPQLFRPGWNTGRGTRSLCVCFPFLFILYIVNYVDRTNLGFAAIGMERDLGFSDRVFGLGAGIFFASYMALQIPGALLVERWSARRVISACMIA